MRALLPPDSDSARARAETTAAETALMVRFRDGDPQAFEHLYRLAGPPLLCWIERLCTQRQDPTDPAELLQDTFVNVYRYAGSFRGDRGHTFRAWARTIAANLLRRSRRPRATRLLELPAGPAEPEEPSAGPAEQAIGAEEQRRLAESWTLLLLHYAAAAEQLSPRDREALRLIEVEGLTYAEAGRRLRVGPSNMKMIMFRCRKRIRRHVGRAMGLEEAAAALRVAG